MTNKILPFISCIILICSCGKDDKKETPKPAQWTVLDVSGSGLPQTIINTMHIDKKDRFWVGTEDSGMYMYNGNKWTHYGKNNSGLNYHWVTCINSDKLGRVWVGCSNGLYIFNDST